MGLFAGSRPAVAVPEVVPTKAPGMADRAIWDAYAAAKKRYAAAGTKTTILTSGGGDLSIPRTASKTLLGQ